MRWESSVRHRVLPGVKEIHWMGFRGYVDDLHQAGWQFAEEVVENPCDWGRRHCVVMRHPTDIVMLGQWSVSSIYKDLHVHHHARQGPWAIPVRMDHIAREIYVRDGITESMYRADVAAEAVYYQSPQYRDAHYMHQQYRGIGACNLFNQAKPSDPSSPRVVLEEATLDDVLNYALQKQKPVQDELRTKMVQENRVAAQLIHAA